MPRPHFYSNLDSASKLTLEIDMRELAERLVSMNFGVHRLLSHLIDVRRERLSSNIARCQERGEHSLANNMLREGDRLVEGIAELLQKGLV